MTPPTLSDSGSAGKLPAPAIPRSRTVAAVLLAMALLIALLTQLSLWDQVLQDDAYISFVYARNLVRGEGLVYNRGEPPVEGYTNFLWTVLVAGGMRLGLSPEVVAQAMGIAASLAILVLTFLLARRLGARPSFAAGASLLLAGNLAFSMEAAGGLETPLFGLFVLLGLHAWLRPDRTAGTDRAGAVWLALASLTRPEGVFVFGVLELASLLRFDPGGRRDAWLARLHRVIPFAVIVGAHLAFRVTVYGDWVPNTFHAKVVGGTHAWLRGLRYVLHGIESFGWILFLLPLVMLPLRRGERAPWIVASLHLAYGTYVALVGGDFKLTFRYLVPLFPLWCALAADAFDALARHLASRWPSPRRAALFPALSGAALVLLGGWGAWRTYEDSLPWMGRSGRDEQLHAVGRYLHDTLPPDAWIAVSNAGIVPYEADLRTIDMLGLNDRHIALRPVRALSAKMAGHEKGDGNYVLGLRPDAILFIHLEVTNPATHTDIPGPIEGMRHWPSIVERYAFGTSEKEIAANPAFRQAYEPRSAVLPGRLGWVNVFVRRDAPRPRREAPPPGRDR